MVGYAAGSSSNASWSVIPQTTSAVESSTVIAAELQVSGWTVTGDFAAGMETSTVASRSSRISSSSM